LTAYATTTFKPQKSKGSEDLIYKRLISNVHVLLGSPYISDSRSKW